MTIDTVHLHIKDFSVTPDTGVIVTPSSYVAGTGEMVSDFPLYRNTEGKEYRGAMAKLNVPAPAFQLTIKPFTRGGNVTSNCFLQFSIPKVYSGSENNFYSVGEGGSQAVFKTVEKELWKCGVHTDLNTAEFTRVDTFKNIEPEEEFSSYAPLFGMLQMRRGVDKKYPEGFLLKNTQQEFCVYDKIAEMKKKKVDVSHFPAQAMRFEHRLMNKAKVQKVYGFSSVKDLFSGGYETVKKQRVNQWKNSLFSHTPEEVIHIGAGQLQAEMQIFKDRYDKKWFEWFLKSYGAYHLAQVAGIEVVKLALQNFEPDRMKVWRAEKTIDMLARELEMFKQVEGRNKTLGTLYMELKEKVCLN